MVSYGSNSLLLDTGTSLRPHFQTTEWETFHSSYIHGDGMESGLPPLPAKNYDSPVALPPRDYPVSPDHVKPLERTGDLISDDDYYAQMMNVLNS